MAVQYGKCTNRAGCTLAYTGDQIRFEGNPICPECGQGLAVIKGPGGGGRKVWLLILLPIVLIGMVAAGYFLVQAVLNSVSKPTVVTTSPTASATASASATTNPSASASASASASPTETPTPDQSPSPSASESPTGGSVEKKPNELSKSDIEETRQEVLKRIAAMPHMSQSEKDKLQDKVQSASAMKRLQVVYFEVGKNMIGKPAVDELVSSLNSSDMKEKMSDPTLVFVVAGYADKGGNPASNYRLSNERAENISRIMKSAGVTNVIHTVAMGGTDILDEKRADQNRAVEIWSVIP